MLNVEQIKQMIPHRYPMLLLDQVVHLGTNELTARKAVSANEPWYAGLGVQAPASSYAYPTALVIESWCQAACVLAAASAGVAAGEGRAALFGSVSQVEVGDAVYPGSVLHHSVRLVKAFPDTWVFEGESVVDESPVLRVGAAVTALRPFAALR